MSGLPLVVNHDERADAEREQLLALRAVRRGLERVETGWRAPWRALVAVTTRELVRELEELIAALDRRVPRVERAGEAAIAREAAALRAKAVQRLRELVADQRSAAAEGSEPTP